MFPKWHFCPRTPQTNKPGGLKRRSQSRAWPALKGHQDWLLSLLKDLLAKEGESPREKEAPEDSVTSLLEEWSQILALLRVEVAEIFLDCISLINTTFNRLISQPLYYIYIINNFHVFVKIRKKRFSLSIWKFSLSIDMIVILIYWNIWKKIYVLMY